jgi:hypothetical protein
VTQVAAQYIATDVAMTPLITGRALKAAAHEPAGRTGVYLAAAAVALLIAVGGLAYALGLFGPGSSDPGASQVAQPSASATEAASVSPGPATAAPSDTPPPAVAQPPDELVEIGLWPDGAGFTADPAADAIYSDPSEDPGYFPGYTDQVAFGASVVNAAADVVGPAFNATIFDCTNVVDGVLTACASNNDIDPGPLFVAVARFAEPVPLESDDGLLTYALVLEADRDPSNDFEAEPPFTDDFYQGTDRWYELIYTPELGWYLTVDRNDTTSDARVAIMGDLLVFFVPLDELAVDLPNYRITAFASSDASYAPATSGGDVTIGPPADDWGLTAPDGEDGAAAGFVTRLGDALAEGDTTFLLDRMHSAVEDRYGRPACEAYAAAVVDPANELVPGEATGPDAWDYETDDLSTAIADAYTVVTSGSLQGQAIEGAQFHVAIEDGTFRWFTDCGEPAG